MSNNNEKPLMSIDEFCDTLSIGKNVAYQLLNSHAIDAFRVGRVWKIPRENVLNFIKEKASMRAEIPINNYNTNKSNKAPFNIKTSSVM